MEQSDSFCTFSTSNGTTRLLFSDNSNLEEYNKDRNLYGEKEAFMPQHWLYFRFFMIYSTAYSTGKDWQKQLLVK